MALPLALVFDHRPEVHTALGPLLMDEGLLMVIVC